MCVSSRFSICVVIIERRRNCGGLSKMTERSVKCWSVTMATGESLWLTLTWRLWNYHRVPRTLLAVNNGLITFFHKLVFVAAGRLQEEQALFITTQMERYVWKSSVSLRRWALWTRASLRSFPINQRLFSSRLQHLWVKTRHSASDARMSPL